MPDRVKFRLRIGRFSLGLSHVIFALVFLLRLFALSRLSHSALLLPTRGDMHFYDDWAQRILHGEITDHFAFYGLPGYAYLLAFFYRIFGYNPFVVGLAQAALDAGVGVVIYLLAVQCFCIAASGAKASQIFGVSDRVQSNGKIVGLIAAIGWGLFVPAQAYAVVLMPTAWFVFVYWLVVWRIARTDAAPGTKECFWLGLLVGVTATAVATILAIIPLILVALLVRSPRENSTWKTVAAKMALVVAGLALGTSPCWIHNYFVARDPVFLSAHGGINFWIGNNPTANGYPRFPPGLRAGQAAMLQDSITQAEAAAGHGLKRSEVSAYWSAKAKDYVASHFTDWLKLLAVKLRNFWSAFQYDDLSIITNVREQRVILPGLYFGVVAAFAIPGMLFSWWALPAARWPIAAVLLSMCALLTVFITERYRLVVVPGLLIFAAIRLSIFWRACMSKHFGAVAVYLVLLGASVAIVARPQRDPSLWALDAYNSGWQALESNDFPLAEKKLAIAYAYVPSNSETLFALGNLRLAQNQRDAGKSFYHAVLALAPKHKGALNNLGVISFEAGDFEQARMFFEQALVQAPHDAKTYYLLAKTFLAESNRPAATSAIEKAIKLNPAQPEFAALREQIYKSKQ